MSDDMPKRASRKPDLCKNMGELFALVWGETALECSTAAEREGVVRWICLHKYHSLAESKGFQEAIDQFIRRKMYGLAAILVDIKGDKPAHPEVEASIARIGAMMEEFPDYVSHMNERRRGVPLHAQTLMKDDRY